MRRHIVLYLLTARFAGAAEIPYEQAPEIGSSHDCILFVSQARADHDFDFARALMKRYGWADIEFSRAGPFSPESINSQQMSVFQRHYEECVQHGDALVWYA